MERVTYEIDALDIICAVGDSWRPFAIANLAPELANGVIGRSLWNFVTEQVTQQVYRDLIERAKAGFAVSFSYRCDAPRLRRFMRMTMTGTAEGGVLFDSLTLNTEPRVAPLLLPVEAAPGARMLRSCSWCKRIAVGERWEEAEVAVECLGLFAGDPMPMLTHAMCPDCIERVMNGSDFK
jgi:hypothetical protein